MPPRFGEAIGRILHVAGLIVILVVSCFRYTGWSPDR